MKADILNAIENLKVKQFDRSFKQKIIKHINNLTKPVGSLGLLEDIAIKMGLIQNKIKPEINKKILFLFASDHGIADEGISAYPKSVTAQMVFNFLRGGAAINVFSRLNSVEVFVIDAGVDYNFNNYNKNFLNKKVGMGTKNFLYEDAMTEEELNKAIKYGMELGQMAKNLGADIVLLGDMGIGNTTVATAISYSLGIDIESLIDIGTVIDNDTLKKKKEVIIEAVKKRNINKDDPFDILKKAGGFCFAEMTGFILSAISNGIPVLLDGYPTTAAGLIAYKLKPEIKDYLFASHVSAVKGHKVLLDYMGLHPILDLKMRLGEGTGAALATNIIDAACRMSAEMATFEDAGVSKGDEEY
jgi:nicotinate-nucleotide--dimethylbenzimidazole phosphoribosyltransferase